MKKNIFIIILLLLFTIYIYINQSLVSKTIINTSILFITKVMPSLLPMFIISKLLINYNYSYYIAKLCKNNIYIYILITSLLSGSPNNVIIIKDLLNNNVISIKEANKYIKCSFFNNPLFLYTMLNDIFNKKIAIIIIISQIIVNIIIYLIHPIKNTNLIKIKSKSFSDILTSSIKDASNIMLNIYFTIIIFNIIILIIPESLKGFIGIIELTKGLDYLSNEKLTLLKKLLLSIIYISFGGLSIHMQIKSVIKDTNINYYNFYKSRLISIILSIIFILLLIPIRVIY